MSRAKHRPQGALVLPTLTPTETTIIYLRANGGTYRDISKATRIAPRKVHDIERAGMIKLLRYAEVGAFLGVQ